MLEIYNVMPLTLLIDVHYKLDKNVHYTKHSDYVKYCKKKSLKIISINIFTS